jgi:hypothetical protein
VSSLSEFLLERIAEDEAAAQEAKRDALVFSSRPPYAKLGFAAGDLAQRFDPARVLAECEAKRAIVELHRPAPSASFHHGSNTGSVAAWAAVTDPEEDLEADAACETCGEFSEYAVPWPCQTLRLLALPYADHPDYDEEWRP